MPTDAQQLVRHIHAAGTRFVIACAGGGARAIAQLLDVPGASRSVLAVVVPYGDAALTEWLGGQPDQACAAPTARAIAMAAFRRALRYDNACPTLAGLGCTASLATDRPKRGAHRVHLAAQTSESTVVWSLELAKGRRSRSEEEQVVSYLLLNLIAETCGLSDRLSVEQLEGERVEQSKVTAPEPWRDLLLGRMAAVRLECPSAVSEERGDATNASQAAGGPVQQPGGALSCRMAIFPGAFHPLHAGHRRMAQIAREWLGVPIEWEISVFNVDKPPLDYLEIDARIRQFDAGQRLWLTRAPTFLEKSRQFPGATFIVGTDTLRRIADPRYYGNVPLACREAIGQIAAQGCRFLVFGRVAGASFVTLADLDLPESLRALCREVPADVFREDLSSTELRWTGQRHER